MSIKKKGRLTLHSLDLIIAHWIGQPSLTGDEDCDERVEFGSFCVGDPRAKNDGPFSTPSTPLLMTRQL